MKIIRQDWRETSIPFVWSRGWSAMMDTAPTVEFISGRNWAVSLWKPCDHEWVKTELHGDQRLSFDARYVSVCANCKRVRRLLE